MTRRILIFAEQRSGVLHRAVPQLITAARELDSAAEITICVIGYSMGGLGETLRAYGPARVVVIDDARLERYRPQPYVRALHLAVESAQPSLVLLAATCMGRDMAPRLAVRTRAALATDCIEAFWEGDTVVVRRPVYLGKMMAQVELAADRLKIVSIRPNLFRAADPAGGLAAVDPLALDLDAAAERLVNHECAATTGGVKDVSEADIVVSGGRSLKSEASFTMLYDLAAVLDAAVGASRAACDAGYQPHSRQVGLTGKTVTPRLYLAFGIDGAVQHLAGMRGSKVIVAINTKREAPIFSVATYGCVADLFTMVPLLTEECKRALT